ncbi:hypothetical protein [Aurantiacibacter gangjinensis]|uniref:Uncharacterized protein n=1 Tax=Aurantiacibacter gangjinensis TaxID=502682 RepID=A0A0G9MR40_9SPHN|nr:hypothetical protein [Aurantiacibacter gangjinensis]KLE33160.1 hypothetical protein AAW01_04065 [Aurantiacibacter gangjinensis]
MTIEALLLAKQARSANPCADAGGPIAIAECRAWENYGEEGSVATGLFHDCLAQLTEARVPMVLQLGNAVR